MYIARLFRTEFVDSTLQACFRLGLWMYIARLFQTGSVDSLQSAAALWSTPAPYYHNYTGAPPTGATSRRV